MARYRRESKLDGNQVPKPLEVKVKALNDDWSRIASLTANLFAARVKPRRVTEEIVTEVKQQSDHVGIPLIIEDWREGKQKFLSGIPSLFLSLIYVAIIARNRKGCSELTQRLFILMCRTKSSTFAEKCFRSTL